MLRLSKLTDYAVVVLVRLSETEPAGEDAVQTSPGIAAATGVPEPTVAKVLKALACGGLVASQRGARGGYRLARPLGSIAIADVIAAIDGPIALTACVDGSAPAAASAEPVRRAGPLGPGERRDPPGARPRSRWPTCASASIPPAFRVPQADAGRRRRRRRIGAEHARRRRNDRHRPVRHAVRATSGASSPTSRWTSRPRA